jgi:hypothetical protein
MSYVCYLEQEEAEAAERAGKLPLQIPPLCFLCSLLFKIPQSVFHRLPPAPEAVLRFTARYVRHYQTDGCKITKPPRPRDPAEGGSEGATPS